MFRQVNVKRDMESTYINKLPVVILETYRRLIIVLTYYISFTWRSNTHGVIDEALISPECVYPCIQWQISFNTVLGDQTGIDAFVLAFDLESETNFCRIGFGYALQGRRSLVFVHFKRTRWCNWGIKFVKLKILQYTASVTKSLLISLFRMLSPHQISILCET